MYARTITFANPAASCGQRVYHVLPGNRQVNVESYIPGTWYLDTAEHPIARICNKALTSPINRLRESLGGGRREIGSREAALLVQVGHIRVCRGKFGTAVAQQHLSL